MWYYIVMYEIERKFLLKKLPNNLNTQPVKIVQAYLCDNPVLRIRQWENQYFFTYKGNGLMKRQEIEIEISKNTFDSLIAQCRKIIVKNRYILNMNKTFEIDVFEGDLKGLILAEVEFIDEDEALNFNKPEFLHIEVTNNPLFQNVNLKESNYEQIIQSLRI